MAGTATTTFSREALDGASRAPPATSRRCAREAFERFEAMPIPSQETEEWRYTDLSDLDLSFRPHVPGHGRGVPAGRG